MPDMSDWLRTYTLPTLLASLLHGLFAVLLIIPWLTSGVEVVPHQSSPSLTSHLVPVNPLRERQRAKTERKRRALRLAAEQQAAQEAARQEAADRRRREEAERKRRAEAARLAEAQKQATQLQEKATAEARREELHRELRASLAATRAQGATARPLREEDEAMYAFADEIRSDIMRNWSRPPSARNGMQTLLRVFLVPTGEVISVAVVESSGNVAFDRSAVRAVEKAESFIVPTDSGQFERNFREFTVLFRPEDLRF